MPKRPFFMIVSAASLTGSIERFKARLTNARWLRRDQTPEARQRGQAPIANPTDSYVRIVLESMAVFRFVAFALGTGLIFGLGEPEAPDLTDKILVSVAGAYNILVILGRFNLAIHARATRVLILAGEVPLVIILVLFTGALESPFLLYSLAPILAASLLTDVFSATIGAVVMALSIIGAHIAAGIIDIDVPWILTGNLLAISLLYSAVSLLVSYLPFLSNLNWQRRVRAESMLSERQRLRREVHDNVAQTLAFLSLKAKRAEEKASDSRNALSVKDVGEIADAVQQAYLSVRDFLDGADDREAVESLSTRINTAARRWSRETGLTAKLNITHRQLTLDPNVEHQLLQIAREALANAGKHALADNVWLGLEYTPEGLELHIQDDGRGFTSTQPRGHGLQIMKERASMIGASLDITTGPGQGTLVKVIYPIDGRKARS